jgi:hypothetical protein
MAESFAVLFCVLNLPDSTHLFQLQETLESKQSQHPRKHQHDDVFRKVQKMPLDPSAGLFWTEANA